MTITLSIVEQNIREDLYLGLEFDITRHARLLIFGITGIT